MKIAAANWKMNLSADEARTWCEEAKLRQGAWRSVQEQGVRPAVFVPFPYLTLVRQNVPEGFMVGAQNIHHEEKGAYTGEISARMVQSVGADAVLIGHSERRLYQKESDAELQGKMVRAFTNNLFVVFCVGENLEERQAGRAVEVVQAQIKGVFSGLDAVAERRSSFAIAYEPVWAIGTGKEASPADAEAMSLLIQDALSGMGWGKPPVLYGGSVTAANAHGFAKEAHVHGALVGGASLKSDSFLAIAEAYGGT